MSKRDYYEVLGVSKNADKKEIKQAYRELVKKYHPDKNSSPEAETKFKEVQEAYDILSDEQKRSSYDQFGHAGTQGFGGYGGNGGYGAYANGFDFGNINDIFSQFFGEDFAGTQGYGFNTSQRQSKRTRGSDIEANLNISFEEAVFGIEKTLTYKRKIQCNHCNGTGAKNGTSKTKCSQCNGTGQVTRVQNTFIGQIQTRSVCPTCNGQGETIDEKCPHCTHGINEENAEFKIKVPHGIPDGVTLRFRGKGNAGKNGGDYGDLFININVAPHDSFERRGDDIYMEYEIDAITATLGDVVQVPTVHGEVKLKIPAGTQNGKVFKLSGKGGPRFRGGGNGDQYTQIKILIPTKLNREQKRLWEELKKYN